MVLKLFLVPSNVMCLFFLSGKTLPYSFRFVNTNSIFPENHSFPRSNTFSILSRDQGRCLLLFQVQIPPDFCFPRLCERRPFFFDVNGKKRYFLILDYLSIFIFRLSS